MLFVSPVSLALIVNSVKAKKKKNASFAIPPLLTIRPASAIQ